MLKRIAKNFGCHSFLFDLETCRIEPSDEFHAAVLMKLDVDENRPGNGPHHLVDCIHALVERFVNSVCRHVFPYKKTYSANAVEEFGIVFCSAQLDELQLSVLNREVVIAAVLVKFLLELLGSFRILLLSDE